MRKPDGRETAAAAFGARERIIDVSLSPDTGKTLPTIVMSHGGPASRDEWGFDGS